MTTKRASHTNWNIKIYKEIYLILCGAREEMLVRLSSLWGKLSKHAVFPTPIVQNDKDRVFWGEVILSSSNFGQQASFKLLRRRWQSGSPSWAWRKHVGDNQRGNCLITSDTNGKHGKFRPICVNWQLSRFGLKWKAQFFLFKCIKNSSNQSILHMLLR